MHELIDDRRVFETLVFRLRITTFFLFGSPNEVQRARRWCQKACPGAHRLPHDAPVPAATALPAEALEARPADPTPAAAAAARRCSSWNIAVGGTPTILAEISGIQLRVKAAVVRGDMDPEAALQRYDELLLVIGVDTEILPEEFMEELYANNFKEEFSPSAFKNAVHLGTKPWSVPDGGRGNLTGL